MAMGLFDLPAPLFRWIEMLFSPLPPALRLAIWAGAAAALSMWLYKRLSPQHELVETEAAALAARQELNAFDGDFDDAWPLMARVFRTAGSRLWLALPPALLASIPIVALVVWLSNDYGYRFPSESEHAAAQATPGNYEAAMVAHKGASRRVVVREPQGNIVSDVPIEAPVPIIEKRRWWNLLIGNPAGYLPDAGPVDSVRIELPAFEVVPVGPGWARGWEIIFFALFLVFSLIIKKIGKIA